MVSELVSGCLVDHLSMWKFYLALFGPRVNYERQLLITINRMIFSSILQQIIIKNTIKFALKLGFSLVSLDTRNFDRESSVVKTASASHIMIWVIEPFRSQGLWSATPMRCRREYLLYFLSWPDINHTTFIPQTFL